MPFFSIIIPVYNRADFIAATINSVLEQKFDDFELIIVNDGSTDNSEDIIKNVAKENSKVKYLWQHNSERGAARNHGFRNALGTYVVFLDSDDLMHEDHLSILYNKINEQNFPNFISTKLLLKRNNKYYTSDVLLPLTEGYYDINLVLKGSHLGCNFAVKKNNSDLRLFIEDLKYAVVEDWMFIAQNLDNENIYIVDANTIIINDHDERSMRGNHQDIINKRILATQWIEENVKLTSTQKEILWGFTYQFCAIHSYTDCKRKETLSYLFKAIRHIGIDRKKIGLLVKNMIGFKLIQKIKG